MEAARQPCQQTRPATRPNQWFAEAYHQHSEVVFAVASRICAPGRAADVTQEVFLRLWQHPERFDETRGTMRAFLVAITRNTAIDGLRSDVARDAREQRIGRRPAPLPTEVDATMLANERTAEIGRALGCLAPDRRDAIVTAFFGQLTYREAAAVLGEAEGTIKSRIRGGLLDLRTLLRDPDVELDAPRP